MTHIKGLGQSSVEEYKKFGEKILAENEQILKKAGVTPTIFDNEQSNNSTVPLPAQVIDNKTEDKDKSKKTEDKKTYEETPIEENGTLNDIKASSGALNTIYKRILRRYNRSEDDESKNNYHEYASSLEELDGKDVNDDLADFFGKNYKKGLHINGGGYAYLEEGKFSSVYSVNGNVSGSYKDEDEKWTLLYNGAFDYENKKIKENGNETSSAEKSGNALFLAKYKTDKLTFGGGGSAYFYDNDTKLYNIYGRATHNASGIALKLNRKIHSPHHKNKEKTSIIEAVKP